MTLSDAGHGGQPFVLLTWRVLFRPGAYDLLAQPQIHTHESAESFAPDPERIQEDRRFDLDRLYYQHLALAEMWRDDLRVAASRGPLSAPAGVTF
jgi:hypothetical protein